MWLEAKL